MQAVAFTESGRVDVIQLPRPTLLEPGDAIVLVTTTAIGPWDIDSFLNASGNNVIPGSEFAGLVVETGHEVVEIQIDDVVANTVQHVSNDGSSNLFGSTKLPGGHAEYVRVPDADRTLIKITVAGEERSVLAGGTVGLAVQAAAIATANSPYGTYRILGCDPLGITVLTALNNAGAKSRSSAIESHPARKTLASRLASAVSDSVMGLDLPRADTVIVGAISEGPGVDTILASVKPSGRIIFAEPYGASSILRGGVTLPEDVTISTTVWPNSVEVQKIVDRLQIHQLDLTSLVSHVIPLDLVQDAYEAAAGPAPGVQKVLIKP